MALYKVLCAVAVTIFLASNGCLSDELECGLGGPDLQLDDMLWRVFIEGEDCGGTLISDRGVLTSCRCNGSLDEQEFLFGQTSIAGAASFEVFGDYKDANHLLDGDMEDMLCVYNLSEPSTMTPVCLPDKGSVISAGTAVLVGSCNATITEPNECSSMMSDFEEDQLCAVFSDNPAGCSTPLGAGVLYYDEEEDSWFIAGIRGQLGSGTTFTIIPIPTVSFSVNDNMTNDFNDSTPTPMLPTSNFSFSTRLPEITGVPEPTTKCPKPHPPKTTKPPCGCVEGEEDFKDDSVFGSGVMMHSSPFILFCVLVISLYSTFG